MLLRLRTVTDMTKAVTDWAMGMYSISGSIRRPGRGFFATECENIWTELVLVEVGLASFLPTHCENVRSHAFYRVLVGSRKFPSMLIVRIISELFVIVSMHICHPGYDIICSTRIHTPALIPTVAGSGWG